MKIHHLLVEFQGKAASVYSRSMKMCAAWCRGGRPPRSETAKNATGRRAKAIRTERFLVDEEGRRVGVLLEVGEYQRILEDLEELESIRAYDAAKASRDEAVPFEPAW